MSLGAPDAIPDAAASGSPEGDWITRRWLIAFPGLFVLAHAMMAVSSTDAAGPVTLSFETMGALFAGMGCGWRAMQSRGRARQGWLAITVAILLWTGGVGVQLAGSLTPVGASGTGAVSMFLFVLYGVPLAFILASPCGDPWRVRVVDGVLAIVLGALAWAYIFGLVPLAGSDEAGAITLAWVFDIQNLFIALLALARYRASSNPRERQLFGVLTAFAWVYMAMAGYYNHFVDTYETGVASTLVGVPFMLLLTLTLNGWQPSIAGIVPDRMFERVVITVSPLILPFSVLIMSAALVPTWPTLAVAGCAIATLAYGVRAVMVQLHGLGERDELARQSHIDALTSLPNRRQFDETLRRELTRARRHGHGVALLMIDVDHFKRLNDTLGHATGDMRLRAVAKALQGCAARGTDMVARFGGEEFAAILPGAGPAEAQAVAQAMCAVVAQLDLPTPAPSGHVTVSIGAAWMARIDTESETDLIEAADGALYTAKRAGRDRVALAWEALPTSRAIAS